MKRVFVTRVGDWWVARPRVLKLKNGEVRFVQRAIQIAPITTRGKRPPEDVQLLADQKVAALKGGKRDPIVNLSWNEYWETDFFPYTQSEKRASTANSYLRMRLLYLQPQCGEECLRETKIADLQSWINEIFRIHGISSSTLGHIKALLSGMLRYAATRELIDLGSANEKGKFAANPVRSVTIPRRARPRRPGGNGAYALETTLSMLRILPEPANTVVAVAAYTGMRYGEIRGLTWECYTPPAIDGEDGSIMVQRSLWRNHADDPKSRASKAAIPVIPALARKLAEWRAASGNPASGPVFPNGRGKPADLNAMYDRVMKPLLEKAGITWLGWHAFRRGLGTNLNRIGISDSTIQRVLRHADVATTQACYIRPDDGDAGAAMRRFSDSLASCSRNVLKVEGNEAGETLQ